MGSRNKLNYWSGYSNTAVATRTGTNCKDTTDDSSSDSSGANACTNDGYYYVNPNSQGNSYVYCDMGNGGWTRGSHHTQSNWGYGSWSSKRNIMIGKFDTSTSGYFTYNCGHGHV